MQVAFGEVHKIVGADPALGAWDLGRAPAMAWSEGDVWRLDVSLPAGSTEFKVGPQVFCHSLLGLFCCAMGAEGAAMPQCVKASGEHCEWEGGSNRTFQVRPLGKCSTCSESNRAAGWSAGWEKLGRLRAVSLMHSVVCQHHQLVFAELARP